MEMRLAWAAVMAMGWMSGVKAQESIVDLPFAATRIELDGAEVVRGRNLGGHFRRAHPVTQVASDASEPLPADAKALIADFDVEAAAIRQKAEQEIQTRRQTLINALQALQDGYTRDAKLDEAVAIRDMIRRLRVCHLNVQSNPGNLSEYADQIGRILYFDVVGRSSHVIWGSEVYTCDSDLATAAVHAGVLKPGQRGVVKVTIVTSPETHRGSSQNGVTSSNWGSYSASYTVERAIVNAAPPAAAHPAPALPENRTNR